LMVLLMMVIRKLGGKVFRFERDAVLRILESLEAESLTGRKKLYIEHGDKKFPVKQIIAALTGIPRSMFTTADACEILIRLGFEVKEWRGE